MAAIYSKIKINLNISSFSPSLTFNKYISYLKKFKYLAVSNFGVPACVGSEDSAQSRNSRVALKRRVLGQRAVQIPFDLVCSQRARAQRLLHQLSVITGVSGHVVYSACGTKVTVTPNTVMSHQPTSFS